MQKIYGVIVYCGICERRLGKANQGGDRVDIICTDCADKEDRKRVVEKVAAS